MCSRTEDTLGKLIITDIYREILLTNAQQILRGAKHVVQTVNLETPLSGDTSFKDNSFTETFEENGSLILEYLERGDLHQWICKATEENITFEDGVLWAVFNCREYCR